MASVVESRASQVMVVVAASIMQAFQVCVDHALSLVNYRMDDRGGMVIYLNASDYTLG